jgi:hypothetical protein
MRNVLGADGNFPTDFVLVLVLVLETSPSPEKSDYENEDDDEDDPASVFLAPFFQPLASDFRAPPFQTCFLKKNARLGQRAS